MKKVCMEQTKSRASSGNRRNMTIKLVIWQRCTQGSYDNKKGPIKSKSKAEQAEKGLRNSRIYRINRYTFIL